MSKGEFAERLYQTLVNLRPIDTSRSGYVLVFAAACAVVGLLAVVLDLCSRFTVGRSIMGLSHSVGRTPIFLVMWPAGAAITGYAAAFAGILQPCLLSCVSAGVAWHLIARQLLLKRPGGQVPEDKDPPGVEE
jgi:hypothetical protein